MHSHHAPRAARGPALVLEQPLELSLRRLEGKEYDHNTLPYELTPGTARVEMVRTGICGSDTKLYLGHSHGLQQPIVLLHEGIGRVVEVGGASDKVSVGDLVAIDPQVYNPHSIEALEGNPHLDGGVRFAATPPVHGYALPWIIHPTTHLEKVDHLPLTIATLAEPMACAVHACNRLNLRERLSQLHSEYLNRGELYKSTALVQGNGPMGLLVALAAIEQGVDDVFITGKRADKLKLIFDVNHRLQETNAQDRRTSYPQITPVCIAGLQTRDPEEIATALRDHHTWGGKGFNAIFNCTPDAAEMNGKWGLVRKGGGVCFVGGTSEEIVLPAQVHRRHEFDVVASRRYNNTFTESIRILEKYQHALAPLVTHEFSAHQLKEAMELSAKKSDPSICKIQIDMETLKESAPRRRQRVAKAP